MYDYYEELDELYALDEMSKNIRKPETVKTKSEPVKTVTGKHFGKHDNGVTRCTSAKTPLGQFKCANFKQHSNRDGCSYMMFNSDCMNIDVQRRIKDGT